MLGTSIFEECRQILCAEPKFKFEFKSMLLRICHRARKLKSILSYIFFISFKLSLSALSDLERSVSF